MPEDVNMSSLPTRKLGVAKTESAPVQQSRGTESANLTPETAVSTDFSSAGDPQPPWEDIPETTVYLTALPSTNKPKELGHALRARCKQLGVSLFFQSETSVRAVGFTSAIPGEGKTFLARLTAEVMAEDNGFPVVLLECNWENPTLSSAYDLTTGPGLSEWLLGRCELAAIRRQITNSLTVIPAGNSSYNASQLLRIFQQRGVQSVLTSPNEVLIIDLPATVTTAYGPFAAQLADVLILVVRMGVTPEHFVTEACHSLKNLCVHGIVFNQVTSRIPRWLRRIL
jgi:Mrp family chromosome partitioning ATPase